MGFSQPECESGISVPGAFFQPGPFATVSSQCVRVGFYPAEPILSPSELNFALYLKRFLNNHRRASTLPNWDLPPSEPGLEIYRDLLKYFLEVAWAFPDWGISHIFQVLHSTIRWFELSVFCKSRRDGNACREGQFSMVGERRRSTSRTATHVNLILCFMKRFREPHDTQLFDLAKLLANLRNPFKRNVFTQTT